MTRRLCWDALMRLGVGHLRLSPDAFWALTPRELRALVGDPGGVAALDHAGLAALMRRHPDTQNGGGDDR